MSSDSPRHHTEQFDAVMKEPMPCDNCTDSAWCAKRFTACEQYATWVGCTSNKRSSWPDQPRIPNRLLYKQVFSDFDDVQISTAVKR